jgi:hypothetical protein
LLFRLHIYISTEIAICCKNTSKNDVLMPVMRSLSTQWCISISIYRLQIYLRKPIRCHALI